jgi:hypothetical protein
MKYGAIIFTNVKIIEPMKYGAIRKNKGRENMKKKILLKTLIPLASVGITLGAVLPLASCSCGNNSSYEQDTIKFNELHSMTVGEEQTITATSSLNKEVTISASGNNLGN